MNNILIQYVTDEQGRKRGTVVAIKDNDKIKFGWSLANVKKGDCFDKKMGLKIAVGRALKNRNNLAVPDCLKRTYYAMQDRAERYFKDVK